jgi:hypothetical protein
MRIRVVELSFSNSELIDAKATIPVVAFREHLIPDPKQLKPFNGSMIATSFSLKKPVVDLPAGYEFADKKFFLSFVEQMKFKFIIHISGNAGAYRLGKELYSQSCLLRMEDVAGEDFKMWLDDFLIPFIHYIPITGDNIIGTIEKFKDSEYIKNVSKAALDVAKRWITKEGILEYCFDKIVDFK